MSSIPHAEARRRSRHRVAGTAVAAVLALVAAFLVTTAPTASAAPTLLSQGKTATASSLENATFPASNAGDGNLGTRWSSAFSDPQWLQVDLGSTQSICQVTLNWEAAYAKSFQIQTSPDAATWTTIFSTTTGTGGNQTLSVSGSGRYIRMYGTVRATPYGYSLWEFQAFGGGSSSPTATPTSGSTSVPPTATKTSVPPTATSSSSFPAWAAGVAYAVGVQVTYTESTHPRHLYKCHQAHTS